VKRTAVALLSGENMSEEVVGVHSHANPVATARVAGLAYLVIIISALFSEAVVRGEVIVSSDSAATAANILAREQLWRWGGAAEFLTASCDVIVAILLYELLKPCGRTVSLLGAVFQLVLVAVAAVKILFHMAPLSLLKARDAYLSHFTSDQLQDLSYFSLRLLNQAWDVSLVFFGVHCLLIGWLIARADFLPRFFGWAMMLTGLCYITNTLVRFVEPQLAPLLSPWILLPVLASEFGLTGWLLIRGLNADKWRAQAARSSAWA
jgi:hypothetical protein